MKIYADAEICVKTETAKDSAVQYAVRNLKRDLQKTCMSGEGSGAKILLVLKECEREGFAVCGREGALEIGASDPLGFVYGIYEVSREILGIHNFWFWNDQKIRRKDHVKVPEDISIISKPYEVKYRGWFINDEVLLHTWKVDQKKEKPWEMAFEALLRCGGNLVIPGTGRNADIYSPMAASMGLYITHHHAQPLGAEMFVQAYPDLNPSFEEHAEKFRRLWEDGIRKQKDWNVVWTLGFRGQGDYPFWVNDPRYQTQKSRGELMGSLLREQYDMVKKECPDAACCTNLYGETLELYRQGYLDIPEDVIRIWADNGFGKMVTRRQENHNPRIYALPEREEAGRHGIYYHVSFYDLQAANHITMLSNPPEFVESELKKVQDLDVKEYWLINCSNIKPHVFYLGMIARIWQQGTVNTEEYCREYVRAYYDTVYQEQILESLRGYFSHALSYGPHEDDHAGEQFSNHVARILISQYMKDQEAGAGELLWATDAQTLAEQVGWYRGLCREAVENYGEYLASCEKADVLLGEELCGNILDGEENSARRLFRDSLLLQAKIHYHCFLGAYLACECLREAQEGRYQCAFYLAGCAREKYLQADRSMREREHGKWYGFYANECLTDVKQTAWVLEGLMSYLRNLGDGPHFYQWQRDFLYTREDRRVMLIMNMENHLKDQELFELMKQKWGDQI